MWILEMLIMRKMALINKINSLFTYKEIFVF